MINRVVLVGRLTRDPDLRYTQGGNAVCNFNIAVNRPFKNQQGESEADFINGVTWRKQAENLANYMKKGSQIGVDGRLQSRTYEGQDGKTVFVTEVVADSIQFLESKQQNNQQWQQPNNQSQQPSGNAGQFNQQSDPFKNNGQPIDINDDDLPF